jgi:hypothetical protein
MSIFHNFLDKNHPQVYRRDKVNELTRAIHARENRLVVGLPGVGISNLLRFLVAKKDLMEGLAQQIAEAPVKITFAYENCDTLASNDWDEFLAMIARQYEKQGVGRINSKLKGFRQFHELIKEAKGEEWERLVVVADKANHMVSTASEALFRRLKALTDDNKRLIFILGLDPQHARELEHQIMFAGRVVWVGMFNESDFYEAIEEEGQKLGRRFTLEEKRQLMALLGGHPGLLRAVAAATERLGLDLMSSHQGLSEGLLAQEDVRRRCQELWDGLDGTQQSALFQVAQHEDSKGLLVDISSRLKNLGVLEEAAGRARVFSPLFEHFINAHTHYQPTELPSVTIVDAHYEGCRNGQEVIVAGQLFKGDQQVHISRLELRLIACLKSEPKIFTKNEIADYVYCESQGDIPDFLITNLIRQVRERLGDNRYIENHRGFGYKFYA